MPMYTVSLRSDIPQNKKNQLAKLITDIHCSFTGAPPTFVNVIFSQNVSLENGIEVNVLGNVRKGRTAESNKRLTKEFHQELSKLLNIHPQHMEISLLEIPARWVMEGGEVLPEPGEEGSCEWLQNGHSGE